MPTQGDKIRILDVPQYQRLVKSMDGIGEALITIGDELTKLNQQIAKLTKTEVVVNGPTQQE